MVGAPEGTESLAKFAKWGSIVVLLLGGAAFYVTRLKPLGASLPELAQSLADYAWRTEPPDSVLGGDAVSIAFLGPKGSQYEKIEITGPDGYTLRRGVLPGQEPRLFAWEWNTFGLLPGEYRIRVAGQLSHKLVIAPKP